MNVQNLFEAVIQYAEYRPSILLNHASCVRTGRGELGREFGLGNFNKNMSTVFINIFIGVIRLIRTMISETRIIREARKCRPNTQLRIKNKLIFSPASSFSYEDGLRCRFFDSDELGRATVVSTNLTLGNKNKTQLIELSKNAILPESYLTNFDIILCVAEIFGNFGIYLWDCLSERHRVVACECLKNAHTEFSSLLLLRAINKLRIPKGSFLLYTHFEFEFGRSVALGFNECFKEGRAHGLIHFGKLTYRIIESLSRNRFQKYFPHEFLVLDELGKSVFPNAKILGKPKFNLSINLNDENHIYIIGSLHTSVEEFLMIIERFSELNPVLCLHPRDTRRNEKMAKIRKNFDKDISTKYNSIGSFVTGFESQFILDCVEVGATYLAHSIDLCATEYLENSCPETLGLPIAESSL